MSVLVTTWSSKSCWKWTAGIVIFCIILIAVPLITYYKVKNRNQEPTFTVDHASVSGFNLTSDGHLTSFFDISLRVNNPDHKLNYEYRKIWVAIFKDKQNLASDTFPGFIQPSRGVTVLRLKPVSLNMPLKKGPAFNFGVESGMRYLMFDVFMTAYFNGLNLEVNCRGVTTVNVMIAQSTSYVTQNSTTCRFCVQ